MSLITLHGDEIDLHGTPPKLETKAPNFRVVLNDLSEIHLSQIKNANIVLMTFPSIDTNVCSEQAIALENKISSMDTVFIMVSMDLPFALDKGCKKHNLNKLILSSDTRYGDIRNNYGVKIQNGTFQSFLTRSVFIIDKQHTIKYIEFVNEITNLPNFDTIFKTLEQLKEAK